MKIVKGYLDIQGDIFLETDRGHLMVSTGSDTSVRVGTLYQGSATRMESLRDPDFALRREVLEAAQQHPGPWYPMLVKLWAEELHERQHRRSGPQPHEHEIALALLQHSHPRAAAIVDLMKRVNAKDSQHWDTQWEKELTLTRGIAAILDRP